MQDWDIVIVGAGPGGLCAGLYGARANRKTVCVENYLPGGEIQNTEFVEDYPGFEMISGPELAQKFFDYYTAVFAEGELTQREKSLIALAVAHAVQCPYCIDAYTQDCLEKGSNVSEMTEAVHVATAIRGGASLVHGVQMRNVAEKISL